MFGRVARRPRFPRFWAGAGVGNAFWAGVVAAAVSTEAPAPLWVIDPISGINGVQAMAQVGDTLYVGGTFLSLGPPSGGAVVVDPLRGDIDVLFPRVAGYVQCAEPDGGGGWFIGGRFHGVGGLRRRNLAHILADGTVAPWGPEADAGVNALSLSGNTLYVGGAFATIGGVDRPGLAAVDARTGGVLPWDPRPISGGFAGVPYALVATHGVVFVGGFLEHVGGADRFGLAVVDTALGRALPWDPQCAGQVYALAVRGDRLYVGGDLGFLGGKPRGMIASVDLRADTVSDWAPDVQRVPFSDFGGRAAVLTIAVTESTVYLGGKFNRVNGVKRVGLACVNVETGALTAWDAKADGDFDPVPGPGFSSLLVDGGTVYAGGISFVGLGGKPFTSYAGGDFAGAVDAITGVATAWDPRPNGGIAVLSMSGGKILMGGEFTSVRDWVPRSGLAALDLNTGRPTDWAPTLDGTLWDMIAYGGALYMGGQIFAVNGVGRGAGGASVDIASGEVRNWNPNCNGSITCMVGANGRIYMGGQFTRVGGVSRGHLAAVDTSAGATGAWDPQANDVVSRLVLHDDQFFCAGNFSTVSGRPRNKIAALDTIGGQPTAWSTPGPGGAGAFLQDIAPGDSALYVGGSFRNFAGVQRSHLVALDLKSGELIDWDARIKPTFHAPEFGSSSELEGGVGRLADARNVLYVGGGFDEVGGTPRLFMMALDPSTAALLPWDPGTAAGIIKPLEDEVLLGMTLQYVGTSPALGIARVPKATPLHGAPPPSPAPLGFSLAPPAPNPVRGEALIGFELQRVGAVSIELYDATGKLRRTVLPKGTRPAGPGAVLFSTDGLAPGVYYYRLRAGGRSSAQKMIVLH